MPIPKVSEASFNAAMAILLKEFKKENVTLNAAIKKAQRLTHPDRNPGNRNPGNREKIQVINALNSVVNNYKNDSRSKGKQAHVVIDDMYSTLEQLPDEVRDLFIEKFNSENPQIKLKLPTKTYSTRPPKSNNTPTPRPQPTKTKFHKPASDALRNEVWRQMAEKRVWYYLDHALTKSKSLIDSTLAIFP